MTKSALARETQAAENLRELSARIESEMTSALAAKASLETRALGLFVLNVGVLTLFLTTTATFHLKSISPNDAWEFFFLIVGLGGSGVSLATGVWAAWPARTKLIPRSTLQLLYQNSRKEGSRYDSNLIPLRIEQLAAIHGSNARKSVATMMSLGLAAVSIAGLAVTVWLTLP